jgi:hypothetical protein
MLNPQKGAINEERWTPTLQRRIGGREGERSPQNDIQCSQEYSEVFGQISMKNQNLLVEESGKVTNEKQGESRDLP